jgi:hypothetical protein
MNPAPIVASLAEQPAYYALYGLYVDYMENGRRDAKREYFARLREAVTFIQPLIGKEQPYMKSWSLRLFTERSAMDRFSPEVVSTAWGLVRKIVDQIGPPAGWTEPRHTVRSWRTRVRRATAAPEVPETLRSARPVQRTSPIDYRLVV